MDFPPILADGYLLMMQWLKDIHGSIRCTSVVSITCSSMGAAVQIHEEPIAPQNGHGKWVLRWATIGTKVGDHWY